MEIMLLMKSALRSGSISKSRGCSPRKVSQVLNTVYRSQPSAMWIRPSIPRYSPLWSEYSEGCIPV